jgi:2,4-dienoyl-CoA reductase-like NADH-dependent reductase (Old Yellow Enzyme family)
VVEALSVTPDCLARINQLVISPQNEVGLARLVDAYRSANPDGILLFQITHSGRKGTAGTTPCRLYGPDGDGSRLLSGREISEIRDSFVSACLLAERVGADGIDFKLCHGYLGSEMLRPANTRTDGWGGSLEARTRFLRESIPEIRSATRSSFVLGARISMYEGIRGGCGTDGPDLLVEDLAQMLDVTSLMAGLGMDYINVSAGIPGVTSEITRPVKQGKWLYLHHLRYARAVADRLASGKGRGSVPAVILSGLSVLGPEAYPLARECMDRGYADFFGLGRQQFADPETPAKLARGETPRWCSACSGCSRLMARQVHDGCSLYDPYYRGLLAGCPEA